MTNKQQPPERIWIDESGKDSSFWNDNGDAIGTIPYARVQSADDARVEDTTFTLEEIKQGYDELSPER